MYREQFWWTSNPGPWMQCAQDRLGSCLDQTTSCSDRVEQVGHSYACLRASYNAYLHNVKCITCKFFYPYDEIDGLLGNKIMTFVFSQQ
jgi:hypothetical protein